MADIVLRVWSVDLIVRAGLRPAPTITYLPMWGARIYSFIRFATFFVASVDGLSPCGKHGLKHIAKNISWLPASIYSKKFKESELTNNSQAKLIDLEDEITLVRLNIRHLLELGLNASDLSEGNQVLRVVRLGASALAASSAPSTPSILPMTSSPWPRKKPSSGFKRC